MDEINFGDPQEAANLIELALLMDAGFDDLLEALKALCDRWKGNPDNYAHGEQIRQAHAAIAKAEGGI